VTLIDIKCVTSQVDGGNCTKAFFIWSLVHILLRLQSTYHFLGGLIFTKRFLKLNVYPGPDQDKFATSLFLVVCGVGRTEVTI
jgi:hypothetical protein